MAGAGHHLNAPPERHSLGLCDRAGALVKLHSPLDAVATLGPSIGGAPKIAWIALDVLIAEQDRHVHGERPGKLLNADRGSAQAIGPGRVAVRLRVPSGGGNYCPLNWRLGPEEHISLGKLGAC